MGTIYPRELYLPVVVLRSGQGQQALQLKSAMRPMNGGGSSNKMQQQNESKLA